MSPTPARTTFNDVVAFLVEVVALVLLGMWGWRQGTSPVARVASAAGLPLIAGILWGLFAAPKSPYDIPALEIGTKVLVLGGAVWAGRTILSQEWWWVFATVVLVNTVLLYWGPWKR